MPRKKSKTRASYSATFKARAVKLARASKKSGSHVARELGISEKTLLAWLQASRAADEVDERHAATQGSEELQLLRQKTARLQEEVDILRKATAYFCNPENRG